MAKERQKGRRGSLATFRDLEADSGIPYSTIRQFVLEGHIPFVQLGDSTTRRVKWSDWDKFIESSTERAEQR
jgi:excisionase family DNA binding protein